MKARAYLHYERIKMLGLAQIGWLLTWGKGAVHSSVYVEEEGDDGTVVRWMTHMTSDPPDPRSSVIGMGDGYTIQITEVDQVKGESVPGCDCAKLRELALRYASMEHGDLNAFVPLKPREWYDEPQGYGGPMYDFFRTCNTYVYYLLLNSCPKLPPRPPGALGWGYLPRFPGPPRS